MEGLDDSDPDDFLDNLGEEHEGVSDLGLREDPRYLLRFLHAQRGRVVRSGLRSMPGLPLRMELGLHDLLIFQLDRELTSHQCRVHDLDN